MFWPVRQGVVATPRQTFIWVVRVSDQIGIDSQNECGVMDSALVVHHVAA
jgi:hypothetical protein